MQEQKYLAHVDGLRAVAVISVIIYHLNSTYLPGGFLGVDIFFVISGYLITNIVYRKKLEGNFYYSDFYTKRIKRIIPALYFMLTASLVAGFIILMPYDFYKTSISSLATIAFISNYQFSLRKGDYFSGNAEEWPLLHTWSLSVEEQYYFVLPLLLVFLVKKEKNTTLYILLAIVFCSTLAAEILSRSSEYKSLSYYSLPTRMQELIVGSVAAIYSFKNPIKIKSNLISLVSFCTLFLILIFFNSSNVFPSSIVLPLSIAAVFIIFSEKTIVNYGLQLKPIIWIGKLSYSLYLIHWPVMALTRYLLNTTDKTYQFSLNEQIFVLITTLALSVLSYYLIEVPLRYRNISKKQTFSLYFILPSSVLALVYITIVIQQGIPTRLDTEETIASKQYFHIDKATCPDLINIGCKSENEHAKRTIFLYGNSHAEHYFGFLSKYLENTVFNVELYASGGCGADNQSKKCDLFRKPFYEKINQNDIVYISYRFDHIYDNKATMDELRSELIKIKNITDKVVLMAQPPKLEKEPLKILNCRRLGINCDENNRISDNYPLYNEVAKNLADELHIVFFNPYTSSNDNLENIEDLLINSGHSFSDNDHLSVYGAERLADIIINRAIPLPFIER